ncbi:hypothetical protein THAOC_31712 [Thalassiosira oceanica]|uniref:RING-type domain-containing protein n=1 Tax=Thalassiosira oceanica TaxID=159749 RepID=K0RRV1_THAOC|nr:hypothetical protein THAOC_31712 [Thalassiosira oceanica]|eukprot:EJK49417.1 hypothetical protein THAOC_31712 [Thalassiosira oceanica]
MNTVTLSVVRAQIGDNQSQVNREESNNNKKRGTLWGQRKSETAKTGAMICGACERELPEGSYSGEQRVRRQSSRRCEECVAAGNQLVLMRKGRTRPEEDDCPICNLPLPLDTNDNDTKQSIFQACCMKSVCNGCVLTARKRGMFDCPFCRTPTPDDDESKILAMVQKRVDAGDPVAMHSLGQQYQFGLLGLEKDVTRAVELYERAAELGTKEAIFDLGCIYDEGTDVEEDIAKAIQHYEAAAMRGDVSARFNLGCGEEDAENYDLALQHWMISAKMGFQDALDNVKTMFMEGLATKADYAGALRGYQSAVEEMRSPDRDEAERISPRAV